MSHPSPDIEPAVRDPKKLRRTAWILVAMMVAGGVLILKAYEQWTVKNAADDRPAIIYRITKERDLRMSRQDGEIVDLYDLKGKVVLIQTASLHQPETDGRSHGVMRRMAAEFADEPDFVLLTLLVDPLPRGDLESTLAETAAARSMELPKWWLGSTSPDPLHRFIKDQLKTSVFPHQEDGKWIYDTSLVLLDRHRHIRRAVVPQKTQKGPPYVARFDFDEAAGWDSQGVKTGTDLSNEEELESLLAKTIRELLVEPELKR
jgi:cytochrome oxidase Cu insertion factor (SCO1/SenC/PrrC family)